jgi:hypothetical protein
MMAPSHELRASIVKPLATAVILERNKDAETKTESCNPQQAFTSVKKVKQTFFLLFRSAQKRKLCTDAKWWKRAKSQDRLWGICQARLDVQVFSFLRNDKHTRIPDISEQIISE